MKRIKLFITALVLSLSSVLGVVAPQAHAATTFTWDGGGSDNKMTTDENWVGDVAPTGNDDEDLVFPANVTKVTVDNDFTAGTSFKSITFSGAATQDSSYTISGNSMTLTGGVTNSMTGSSSKGQALNLQLMLNGNQTFAASDAILTFGGAINLGTSTLTVNSTSASYISFDGVISGSGNIIKSGTGDLYLSGNNSAYSGAISVNAGSLFAAPASLGTAAGGTTVANGAALGFCFFSDTTSAEPITVGGSGDYGAALTFNGCGGPNPGKKITLTGHMTLTANTVLSGGNSMELTGILSGNYKLSVETGAAGTFVINSSNNTSGTANGTLEQATEETTVSEGDNQPDRFVTVLSHQIYIIDGKRGDTTVFAGGVLKGTGTVGYLVVADGGIVAPGHSPGCLNSANLTLSGTYQFEVGGTTACTGYDQIKVTGTVDVTDATLSVTRYNEFVPKAGQKYVIISNDGSDAVSGTFKDLDEGAKFDADGVTWSISYKGGDGNDVELTVTAVSPETGFAILTNNPYATMAAMLGAAGGLALLARRQLRPAFAVRRKR